MAKDFSFYSIIMLKRKNKNKTRKSVKMITSYAFMNFLVFLLDMNPIFEPHTDKIRCNHSCNQVCQLNEYVTNSFQKLVYNCYSSVRSFIYYNPYSRPKYFTSKQMYTEQFY